MDGIFLIFVFNYLTEISNSNLFVWNFFLLFQWTRVYIMEAYKDASRLSEEVWIVNWCGYWIRVLVLPTANLVLIMYWYWITVVSNAISLSSYRGIGSWLNALLLNSQVSCMVSDNAMILILGTWTLLLDTGELDPNGNTHESFIITVFANFSACTN